MKYAKYIILLLFALTLLSSCGIGGEVRDRLKLANYTNTLNKIVKSENSYAEDNAEKIGVLIEKMTKDTTSMKRFPAEITTLLAYAYYNQAHYYSLFLEYTKAKELVNKAMVLGMDNEGTCHYLRAYILYGMLEMEDARLDLDTVIELKPHNPEAYYMRGLVYDSLEDWERAESDYGAAIVMGDSGESTILALMGRGSLRMKQKKWNLAMVDFDKVVALNSEMPEVYESRGDLRVQLGQPDFAVKEYSHSIHCDPDYPPTYYKRGEAYFELRNWELARVDFEKTVLLEKETGYVHDLTMPAESYLELISEKIVR